MGADHQQQRPDTTVLGRPLGLPFFVNLIETTDHA